MTHVSDSAESDDNGTGWSRGYPRGVKNWAVWPIHPE